MKYETLHNISVPKIGFGCWTIGGQGTANPANDGRSLTALRSALSLGNGAFDAGGWAWLWPVMATVGVLWFLFFR